MQFCDWRDFDAEVAGLTAALARGVPASPPFPLLATPASPAIQRKAAELYTIGRHPPAAVPLWRGERYARDRIRVGYLSADLHEHATAHLMVGVFERHDRSRFETFAFSFGRDDNSAMRTRLERAFDRFIDVRAMSDQAVAELVRSLEIDIAVDLKGITLGARTGIFARRPAPVAVSYLGYPGTMGAPYIDYVIADRFVIPEDQQGAFSEQVVTLPDSYQPNDTARSVPERTPTRVEAGLPENGFVFCCFNNSYKITPDVFGVWMRLLHAVEGAVLWLLNGPAVANLRREAAERGIAPERLVFAPRASPGEHLARHRLADLFLDTPYCNAHTTASDALWAELPLVTCAGATFASRVAGSLLRAAGLPELVTHSLADYEALALTLARDPVRLAGLRTQLAEGRVRCPLFDTQRITRHIEAAYLTMWERQQRGQPPRGFAVPAIDGP
jgi:predicted O-linked N-acetylglucosamine transferase (SPINDLY family)